MRLLTTGLILLASASFVHAGEIVTTANSGHAAAPAVVHSQPAEQAAVTPAQRTWSKPNALRKVGRGGCGNSAEARAPLLTQ